MSNEKLFFWNENFRTFLRSYIEDNDPLFLQEYDDELEEEYNFGQKILPDGNPGGRRALIDRKKERIFTINPIVKFPWQERRFYPEMDNYTFSEVMIETAKWLSSSGKTIDFYWSGGTDSNAALLALNEVCPKQLHIIIGHSHECPEIYNNIVKHLDHHIDQTHSYYSLAQPDKHILTSLLEMDLYFGAVRHEEEDHYNGIGILPKEQWEIRRRYAFCYGTMLFFMNFKGDKMDIDNIKPFCGGPLLEKWMINYVNRNEMVFYYSQGKDWPQGEDRSDENNWRNCKGQKHYKKCKMPLRDFIYEMTKNKEIAYNNVKVAGGYRARGPRGHGNKFHYLDRRAPHQVLAVTEYGDIIHNDNIRDYNLFKFLNGYS